MSDGIRAMWMRGGTSKGGYFLKEDMPADPRQRDALLLRVMGSPDTRQIDGMGGASPLTSKIAIVSRSQRPGVDVDYLFLQVFVDKAIVTDAQNCGNILAGVGPFALERGLVSARGDETEIVIFMENSNQLTVATVQTPGGRVHYAGNAHIDGVPGTAAPIALEFKGTAGSTCGKLLPTGNVVDIVEGISCTMIDNGMPCVVIRAGDLGLSGHEEREVLEKDAGLKARLEALRLKCGPMMNLGDVAQKSVPKMMLISPPRTGGAVTVRSFIPHTVHTSIGVFGAVTVATACLLKNSPAAAVAQRPAGRNPTLSIEHPSGQMSCVLKLDQNDDVISAAVISTARKLMDGKIFA